jgi:CspA family cold shock protein
MQKERAANRFGPGAPWIFCALQVRKASKSLRSVHGCPRLFLPIGHVCAYCRGTWRQVPSQTKRTCRRILPAFRARLDETVTSFPATDELSARLGIPPFRNQCRKFVMTIGTVKFFNTSKGFGFIAPEGGGKDVFVHATAVEAAGMRSLTEGQKVSFDIVPDARGAKAANLKSA